MNLNSKNLLWGVGTLLIIVVGLWAVWNLTTAPAGKPAEEAKIEIQITPEDHILGAQEAPVTLVEYSDFQCPACRTYQPLVKQVVAQNPDTVRLVYRHFPLEQHKNARVAAYAAEAAGKQDSFFEFHDLLFENQEDWESEKDPTELFLTYAKELELDVKAFTTDMKSPAIKAKVEKDLQGGITNQVNATPTFYLNGVKVNNPGSYADFEGLIKAAAKSAKPQTTSAPEATGAATPEPVQ